MDNNDNKGTPVAKTIHIIDPRSPTENISRTPIEVRVSDKTSASAASSLLSSRNSKPLDTSPVNLPQCNLSANDDSAEDVYFQASEELTTERPPEPSDVGFSKTKNKSMLVNLLVQRANTRLGEKATVFESASDMETNDINSSCLATPETGDASPLELSDATDSSLIVNVGSFSESRVLDDSNVETGLPNQNASLQSLTSTGCYTSPAPDNSAASDFIRDCNTSEAYLSAEE